MVRPVHLYALTSAVLAASLPAVSHGQSPQYDGYCYVRSADMKRDASTTPCLKGEYYVYTDTFKPAPRAPQGYVVEYFTRRPNRTLYSQVYNASTLTQNFEPGAQNNFGNRPRANNAYAGNGGAAYGGYTSQGYASQGYGSQGYESQGYAADKGANWAYQGQSYSDQSDDDTPAGVRSTDQTYAYGSAGNPSRVYNYGAFSHDEAYGDEQPGSIGPSSNDDAQRPYDNDRTVTGWRDDSGRWHVDRPAAIGWRDTNGQWHVGRVTGYGWRDDAGYWHEQNSDAAYGDDSNSRYGESDSSGY
ncbi:MAG: hypothetical protein ACXU8O_04050 [Asticcacaulis sp.]